MHNGIHSDKLIATLAITASGDEIRGACDWLTTALRRRDVPDLQVGRLELALHEVLANVLAHGGSDAGAEPIRIGIEVHESATSVEASIRVTDVGVPFDPTGASARTPPKTLAEAQPGGLGLTLIRRCTDWRIYRREGGRNQFIFGARWPKG